MKKRLTEEQRDLWAELTNDYSYLARKQSPENLAHTIGEKLQGKSQEIVNRVIDQCFGIVMRRRVSKIDRILIIRLWLTKYNLPMIPSQMSWFDVFHNTHGPLIIKCGYGWGYNLTTKQEEFRRKISNLEFSS